jgi:arylsulfatase A-like enzyme
MALRTTLHSSLRKRICALAAPGADVPSGAQSSSLAQPVHGRLPSGQRVPSPARALAFVETFLATAGRHARSASLALGTVTLLAACGGSDGDDVVVAPEAATRPNILLIMADDLGYSDLGAYGGEIHTPHLDALVASGRLLTNYHTGTTCSPTRAMLMSGTDHHVAGLGSMAETLGQLIANNVAPWGEANRYGLNNLPPGYEGYLNDRVHSLPQVMRDGGYHTYMAGKWHLATMPAAPASTPTGQPFTLRPAAFPKAKGFERSFALLQGGGSHFAPVPDRPVAADLTSSYVEDDEPAALPANFYSSTTYTDKLIEYLESSKGDGKPFFAYLAYTAPHWPLQAPDEDIARYAGKYDEGYDVIRDRRIARQKALGLLPSDFTPHPGLTSPPGPRRWQDLSAEDRALEARKMEVYAAMVENMDRNIGRLIQYLRNTGRYDNTMVVFTSDNGAEGTASQFANTVHTDNSLANIGRPRSNVAYGVRWAEVSAAPFRLFKGYATEGGVTAPMIVRMPRQATHRPLMAELTHVTDLMPTFLEIAGIPHPASPAQGSSAPAPPTGLSWVAQLEGRAASGPRTASDVLADELFTGRYLIRDGWKITATPAPLGSDQWQLFDLRTDRGETTDVMAGHTALGQQMIAEYEAYAARVGVVHARPPAASAP